jgi:hypothetical protein
MAWIKSPKFVLSADDPPRTRIAGVFPIQIDSVEIVRLRQSSAHDACGKTARLAAVLAGIRKASLGFARIS